MTWRNGVVGLAAAFDCRILSWAYCPYGPDRRIRMQNCCGKSVRAGESSPPSRSRKKVELLNY